LTHGARQNPLRVLAGRRRRGARRRGRHLAVSRNRIEHPDASTLRRSERSTCASTPWPGRGRYFIATGRVVRLGNRVAVAHTELENDAGELTATGGAAYMAG
jgi:hypothetical protein